MKPCCVRAAASRHVGSIGYVFDDQVQEVIAIMDERAAALPRLSLCSHELCMLPHSRSNSLQGSLCVCVCLCVPYTCTWLVVFVEASVRHLLQLKQGPDCPLPFTAVLAVRLQRSA
jgi:hypothetical protein